MRNLAIAQHRDKTQFRLVHGPPWDGAKEEVASDDFVLVKRKPLASLASPLTLTVRTLSIVPTEIPLRVDFLVNVRWAAGGHIFSLLLYASAILSLKHHHSTGLLSHHLKDVRVGGDV